MYLKYLKSKKIFQVIILSLVFTFSFYKNLDASIIQNYQLFRGTCLSLKIVVHPWTFPILEILQKDKEFIVELKSEIVKDNRPISKEYNEKFRFLLIKKEDNTGKNKVFKYINNLFIKIGSDYKSRFLEIEKIFDSCVSYGAVLAEAFINKNRPAKKNNFKSYVRFQFDGTDIKTCEYRENKILKRSFFSCGYSSFLEQNSISAWRLISSGFLLSFFLVITIFAINKKRVDHEKLKIRSKKNKTFFDNLPVALWEQDYTELIEYLKDLKRRGILNFTRFFNDNPLHIEICAGKIKVIDINKAAIKLHEAENSDELLVHIEKNFTRSSFEVFKKVIVAIANGETYFESEAEIKTFKNNVINILLKINFYNEGGASTRGIITIIDITAEKKAKQESKRLKNRLIDSWKIEPIERLSQVITKEYNNGLGMIKEITKLALKEKLENKKTKKYLDEILNVTSYSSDITQTLASFSRKQPILPKVYNLNNSLEKIIKIIHGVIGDHMELEINPGDDLLDIIIDEDQAEQILIGLCMIARDSFGGSGKIIIETKNLFYDGDKAENDQVILSIGVRINRLESELNDDSKTDGILEGVYNLVNQNNAKLKIYSKSEKERFFNVYFSGEKRDFSIKKSLEGHEFSKKISVLLVEDDYSILEYAKKSLKSKGYNVLSSVSGIKVLKMAEEEQLELDILITEVIMFEINGKELYENLCKIYPDLKVIFMSRFKPNVIANQGILDEGINFIQKPFSKFQLCEKVYNVLWS